MAAHGCSVLLLCAFCSARPTCRCRAPCQQAPPHYTLAAPPAAAGSAAPPPARPRPASAGGGFVCVYTRAAPLTSGREWGAPWQHKPAPGMAPAPGRACGCCRWRGRFLGSPLSSAVACPCAHLDFVQLALAWRDLGACRLGSHCRHLQLLRRVGKAQGLQRAGSGGHGLAQRLVVLRGSGSGNYAG